MELLATGVLGAPHGLHGYLRLRTFSHESEHLVGLDEVLLRRDGKEQTVRLRHVNASGKDILVAFEGIHTPEDARSLTGWEVWITREQAPALAEGEWYVADLVDCSLVSDDQVVGKVVGTIDGPQSLLLEVQSVAEKKMYLVPFMDQYIGSVDVPARIIELKAPWLLS